MAQYGTNVMRNLISFLGVWLLTALKPHQLPFSLLPHTWASWSENLGTPRDSNPVAPAHRWKFSDSQPPVMPNTSKRPGQGPFLAPVVITDLLKSPAVLPPCRDLSHVRDLFILFFKFVWHHQPQYLDQILRGSSFGFYRVTTHSTFTNTIKVHLLIHLLIYFIYLYFH